MTMSLHGGVCVCNHRHCHPPSLVMGRCEKGNRGFRCNSRPARGTIGWFARRGDPTMAPMRLSVAVTLVALGPAAAADPVTRTDQVGDPLPPGAVARVG